MPPHANVTAPGQSRGRRREKVRLSYTFPRGKFFSGRGEPIPHSTSQRRAHRCVSVPAFGSYTDGGWLRAWCILDGTARARLPRFLHSRFLWWIRVASYSIHTLPAPAHAPVASWASIAVTTDKIFQLQFQIITKCKNLVRNEKTRFCWYGTPETRRRPARLSAPLLVRAPSCRASFSSFSPPSLPSRAFPLPALRLRLAVLGTFGGASAASCSSLLARLCRDCSLAVFRVGEDRLININKCVNKYFYLLTCKTKKFCRSGERA